MDRKTKEILRELDKMRRVKWKPGTELYGTDVHTAIDIVYGLTRILRPGSVIIKQEREELKKSRLLVRRETKEFREDISRFITLLEEMNAELSEVTDGILISLGYHRHDRGDWQLKCDSTVFIQFRDKVNAMRSTKSGPLVQHTPPDQDAGTRKLFEKARKGDVNALKKVQEMIRDRNWVSNLGDLGQDATLQLLAVVAVGDPVWKVGIVEQVRELMAELMQDNPSVLEKLLVRRVINGWIAVHTLELEYAARNSDLIERREFLDRAITRAQKRYTEAIHELARVRRLEAPKTLSRAIRFGETRPGHEGMIPMTSSFEKNRRDG